MILHSLTLRLPLTLRPSAALCGSMAGEEAGLGTGVKGDCEYEMINVPGRQRSPLPVPTNEEEYEAPFQLDLDIDGVPSSAQQNGEEDKETIYENIVMNTSELDDPRQIK